jgi:hypothetical protein
MSELRLTPDGEPLLGVARGMKGFLLDQNLPARLTFKPTLPVTPAVA